MFKICIKDVLLIDVVVIMDLLKYSVNVVIYFVVLILSVDFDGDGSVEELMYCGKIYDMQFMQVEDGLVECCIIMGYFVMIIDVNGFISF